MGLDAYLACAVGGIWDSCLCAVVDINNINKILNKRPQLTELAKLFARVMPLLTTRDIPGLICGKIYGPRIAAYCSGKVQDQLSTLEKIGGSFVTIALWQVYASPMSAAATKLIQNPGLSVYQVLRATVVTEAHQLPQRIVSRMILAASRNAIALSMADELVALARKETK